MLLFINLAAPRETAHSTPSITSTNIKLEYPRRSHICLALPRADVIENVEEDGEEDKRKKAIGTKN